MGILSVDVTIHGVVMSADSQRVEIFGGRNEVQAGQEGRSRLPILMRTGGGFVGLIGFAGTERIEGKETADWLRGFNAAHPDDDVTWRRLRGVYGASRIRLIVTVAGPGVRARMKQDRAGAGLWGCVTGSFPPTTPRTA